MEGDNKRDREEEEEQPENGGEGAPKKRSVTTADVARGYQVPEKSAPFKVRVKTLRDRAAKSAQEQEQRFQAFLDRRPPVPNLAELGKDWGRFIEDALISLIAKRPSCSYAWVALENLSAEIVIYGNGSKTVPCPGPFIEMMVTPAENEEFGEKLLKFRDDRRKELHDIVYEHLRMIEGVCTELKRDGETRLKLSMKWK